MVSAQCLCCPCEPEVEVCPIVALRVPLGAAPAIALLGTKEHDVNPCVVTQEGAPPLHAVAPFFGLVIQLACAVCTGIILTIATAVVTRASVTAAIAVAVNATLRVVFVLLFVFTLALLYHRML